MPETNLTRDEYFELLLEMFTRHIEATDQRSETEIKDQILGFIEKTPLVEADYEGQYEGDGVFADNH